MIGQRIDRKRRWLKWVAISVTSVLTLGLGWFSIQYLIISKQLDQAKNPAVAAENDAKQTVANVGKLIALPNEKPAIAIVSDEAKLKKQSFFKDAKNGDKVLMYKTARKAILYRPSENKVIEVAFMRDSVLDKN